MLRSFVYYLFSFLPVFLQAPVCPENPGSWTSRHRGLSVSSGNRRFREGRTPLEYLEEFPPSLYLLQGINHLSSNLFLGYTNLNPRILGYNGGIKIYEGAKTHETDQKIQGGNFYDGARRCR